MVACTFISFYHCFANNQACLRRACYQLISFGAGWFFFSYCYLFSFSCSMVIDGLAFSSQISRCRCLWQQLSSCWLRSFPLRSRLIVSQGSGLTQSSSDLLREYMTVTFCPLILKSGSLAYRKAVAVSSGEKNSMNAKSLKAPVSLFLICLTSRTGANAQKISNRVLSSTQVTTGPLSIRLQFWADSSRKGRMAGCVLQLRRQVGTFSASHRQHRPLLAKFLQSHFSQYQSQTTLRSTFLTGKYCTLTFRPPNVTSAFTCSITEMAASMLGYRRKSLSPCDSTSSGTLVPILMLRSVNMRSASPAASPTPYNMRVRVSSSLNLGGRGCIWSPRCSSLSRGLRDLERSFSRL